MESEMDSFTVELRYHIYEKVRSSVIGEVLVWRCDIQNRHDPFAVATSMATCKGTTVVGHAPRQISVICYVFLGKPGARYPVAGSQTCWW